MKGVTTVIFAISIMLFLGMVHFVLKLKKPGVYPPKQVLKKKAFVLAVGGIIFLFLGYLFTALTS